MITKMVPINVIVGPTYESLRHYNKTVFISSNGGVTRSASASIFNAELF